MDTEYSNSRMVIDLKAISSTVCIMAMENTKLLDRASTMENSKMEYMRAKGFSNGAMISTTKESTKGDLEMDLENLSKGWISMKAFGSMDNLKAIRSFSETISIQHKR